MAPQDKRFADTPTKRLLKITGMGARMVGRYATTKIKHTFATEEEQKQVELSNMYGDIGEQVLQTLGEMKGAAMKVGQIAAQVRHLFPEEFTEQIEKLQNQAEPVSYSVIESQVKAELGFSPRQLFKDFQQEPFAAASIGQVHRATTKDNREVVLKIQYPGVYTSCRSDLVHIKRLFSLSGLFNLDKKAVDELFLEIEQSLMTELDYQQEADNLIEFRQFHRDNPLIVIPEVIEEYSTEQVLCLSYEPGDFISQLRRKHYSQEQVNRAGITLVEAMLAEVLQNYKFHADPHAGNFAFRQDGRIVVYDYGCVSPLSETMIQFYVELYHACMDQRFDRIDDILLRMGVRSKDYPAVETRIYEKWYKDFIVPILEEINIDKANIRIQQAMQENLEEFVKMRGVFQPLADIVFLNRMVVGHFYNLAAMGVEVDFKPVFAKFFNDYL